MTCDIVDGMYDPSNTECVVCDRTCKRVCKIFAIHNGFITPERLFDLDEDMKDLEKILGE